MTRGGSAPVSERSSTNLLQGSKPVRRLLVLVGFFLAYVVAGKLGLSMAIIHLSASPVWPPTGLAIAGLLIFGRWAWPAVFVGAFVVNMTTAGTAWTSLAIASGNTLEGVVGAALVARFANGRHAFERTADVFRFAALAGLAAPILSASIGVVSLAVAGFASWSTFWPIWATWYVGDAVGALIVAPLIILASNQRAWRWNDLVSSERLAWSFALIVVCAAVFLNVAASSTSTTILFVLVPLAAWGALRFGSLAAAGGTTFVSAFAVLGTLGFSREETTNEGLVVLQAFMGILAVTSLSLAALVRERTVVEANLQRTQAELETRVKERTAELDASRTLLLEAQAIARFGSWEWDLGTNRVTWSDEMFRLYGYAARDFEVTFEKAMERVAAEDVPRIQENVERSLHSLVASTENPTPGIEYSIVLPDGDRRLLRGEGRVLADPAGNPVRMLGVVHDITDRQQAEEARLAALQQRQEMDRLKEIAKLRTNFLNTTAHELNTPLTPIRVQMHLLRLAKDDRQRSHSMEILERNIDRISRLVQDVLDAARLTSNRVGLRKEPVDLARVIRGSLASFRGPATAAGLRLHSDCDPGITVDADEQRLAQVLDNLLANAIKFTPRGGTVKVLARAQGSMARVEVVDTGIGLTPAQIGRLFQPFSQVQDPSTSRGGTGLGLYLSKGIAELHGGTVWCQSDGPGRGSRFVFELPSLGQGVAALETTPKPRTVPGRNGDRGLAKTLRAKN